MTCFNHFCNLGLGRNEACEQKELEEKKRYIEDFKKNKSISKAEYKILLKLVDKKLIESISYEQTPDLFIGNILLSGDKIFQQNLPKGLNLDTLFKNQGTNKGYFSPSIVSMLEYGYIDKSQYQDLMILDSIGILDELSHETASSSEKTKVQIKLIPFLAKTVYN